jgi:hypothetical protein
MTEQTFETWGMEADFKLTDYANGEPWIAINSAEGPELPILNGGFLGLEFTEGLSRDEIRHAFAIIDRCIRRVTYSGPKTSAMSDQPGRGEIARRKLRRS